MISKTLNAGFRIGKDHAPTNVETMIRFKEIGIMVWSKYGTRFSMTEEREKIER